MTRYATVLRAIKDVKDQHFEVSELKERLIVKENTVVMAAEKQNLLVNSDR